MSKTAFPTSTRGEPSDSEYIRSRYSKDRSRVPKDGLYDLADALAVCLNALLSPQSAGFGKFTMEASRQSRNHIHVHIDGGIYSRIAHIVGKGIQVQVKHEEGQRQAWLVLLPTE